MVNEKNIYQTLKDKHEQLKNQFYKQSLDKYSLILFCVDKSTIRSFHASKGYVKTYKPLSIFRTWAFLFLSEKSNVERIHSREEFKKLRKYALKDLEKYWFLKDGGKPQFYQFNKLIDLFFKCLPLWNELDSKTSDWIFENTNVPLDRFSLDLLRKCKLNSGIPKNASMNYIDESNYNQIQKEIKHICSDIPVIVFDLYAWDEIHRKTKPFELIELEKKK